MDEIPYRSAFSPDVGVDRPPSRDEQDYSTLVAVRNIFKNSIDHLYKEFNTFTITKGVDPDTAAKELYSEVMVRQQAYEILAPLFEMVNSAINEIDESQKGNH